MNDSFLVSVIIPTYNREKTILNSINSVLNQSYKNIELIVVDDCSTDNTLKILAEISDSRLKIIHHEINKGQTAARNTGIDAATGKFIAFQDSDDIWHTNKLKKQIVFLEKNNAEFVCCQTAVFNDSLNEFMYNHPNLKNVTEGQILYKDLLKYNCTTTQTFLGIAEIFKEIKFDPDQIRFADWDIALQIVKKFRFFFQSEILVDVFQQKDSITKNPQKGVLGMKRLFEKHKDAILADSDVTESFFFENVLFYLQNRKKSYYRNVLHRKS